MGEAKDVSAPEREHDTLFEEWVRLLESIDHQITMSMLHRQIWFDIRQAVIDLHGNKDGTFINSYGAVYWDSQVMVVRRLADTHRDKPDSLWWLMERVRTNPAVMSRARYIETSVSHDENPGRADAQFTSRYGTGSFVDPAFLKDLQRQLESEASAVNRHADQWIAHRDPRGAVQTLTFAEIHHALDTIAELANEMNGLLKRVDFRYEMLTITGDWRAPLRASLFQRPLAERAEWEYFYAPSFT